MALNILFQIGLQENEIDRLEGVNLQSQDQWRKDLFRKKWIDYEKIFSPIVMFNSI